VPAPDAGAAALGAEGEALHLSQVLRPEALEADIGTRFSHVRVYRRGSERCLSFVWDDGQEAAQSCVDLSRPWDLRLGYLRQMVRCHERVLDPRRVLVIGLGGGALVHFYRYFYPAARLDVVEVDQAIIDLSSSYFGVYHRPGDRVFLADACDFVRRMPDAYCVAHVDAFLKPSAITTEAGTARCSRSPEFLDALRRRLRPGGAAVFNCHDSDINDLLTAFPDHRVLPAPGARVVIGWVS
jgi:spermidine synthase